MNKIKQLFARKSKHEQKLTNDSLSFLVNQAGEPTLYIFDDIGWYGIEAQDFANQLSEFNGEPLTVRISSNGGSVADGLAIYNMLRDYKGTVTTINDSIAASIASVIYMAGDVRKVAQTGSFMTHKPMSSFYGNSDELQAFETMLTHFNDVLVKAYEQGGVSESEAQQLIESGDKWIMSTEAIEIGIATELSEAQAAAASVDLTKFDNVPDSVLNASNRSVKTLQNVSKTTNTKSEVVKMENENTISQAEHEAAVAEASSKAFAEALKRREDVLALENAKGREAAAEKMIANAKLSVEEIDDLLASLPEVKKENSLSQEDLVDTVGDLGPGNQPADEMQGDDQTVNKVSRFAENIGKKI